jgi:hypothetical protein
VKIWYLYFDGGYERDELLFAVPSEAIANQCKQKMDAFAQRAKARLPVEPSFFPEAQPAGGDDWNVWYDAHEKAVAKIRWPYGINMLHKDCVCVGSMPLKAKR